MVHYTFLHFFYTTLLPFFVYSVLKSVLKRYAKLHFFTLNYTFYTKLHFSQLSSQNLIFSYYFSISFYKEHLQGQKHTHCETKFLLNYNFYTLLHYTFLHYTFAFFMYGVKK